MKTNWFKDVVSVILFVAMVWYITYLFFEAAAR